jgi:hypothetical protein
MRGTLGAGEKMYRKVHTSCSNFLALFNVLVYQCVAGCLMRTCVHARISRHCQGSQPARLACAKRARSGYVHTYSLIHMHLHDYVGFVACQLYC